MMVCEVVRDALTTFDSCVESEAGARVPTHCLYPSFDYVHVYVVKYGHGFKVHDAGGAFRCAWEHGRESPIITRYLNQEALRFHLAVVDTSLVAEAPSVDWLEAAILSVSNASAAAATRAVAHLASAVEYDLVAKIYEILLGTFSSKKVSKEFISRGRSGKEYRYDIGVRGDKAELVLINAVSPHPASIAAKYVSFADGGFDATAKLAVHERPLEADDVSLLSQVAEIVPLRSLVPGTRRAIDHAHLN
jgi:hypothetical protein